MELKRLLSNVSREEKAARVSEKATCEREVGANAGDNSQDQYSIY